MVAGDLAPKRGLVEVHDEQPTNDQREQKPPAFPPSARDAIILGGTVFDLLEHERGADACSILVSRLRREGAERAIELAFDARFRVVEREWRRYLREDLPRAGSLGELPDEDPFA